MMNDDEFLRRTIESSAQPTTAPTRAIPYNPVPMSWNISQAHSPEGPLVVISIQTPEGDKVFFVNPDIGKQIGEALVKASSAADTGLILPQ